MIGLLSEMLTYPFVIRAFVAGSIIAVCAALIGVVIVLKRISMIGDGLSHVGFAALAIASVCSLAPLYVALPIVVLAAFLLLRLTDSKVLSGDSATAIISVSALSIGVLILSVTTGMTTDVNNYMFGSILSMSGSDAVIGVIVSLVMIAVFVLFYNRMFAVTFDEDFAAAVGMKVDRYRMIMSVMTAAVVVVGLKIVGAMLISGLLIFPALSAMRIADSYLKVTISAAVISLVCFIAGITLSLVFAIPSGATVIICNLIVFLITCIFKKR